MTRRSAVRPRAGAAFVLGIAFTIALAACGSDAPVKATDDGKITVTGTGKKAEVTIKGDGTDVTFNQQKIPAGFPSDVPLPTGLTRIAATSGTNQGTPLFQLTYSFVAATGPTAIAAYQRDLEAAGFTIDQRAPNDAAGSTSLMSMAATGHGWQVSTTSIPGPKPRTLVVTVTR